MRTYLVTFHRLVADGRGGDRRVPQQRTVVQARSDVAATWQAKAWLCKLASVADWRLQADACDVVELNDAVA